jgi:hypothetical protein
VTARLQHHHLADVILMLFDILSLLQNSLPGDRRKATGDNSEGFPTGMSVNTGDIILKF